ncbi:MAG: fumarate hydratase [Candidatus Izimaplasma sp.]|nr:fumarate hydratase [Candidatus Izimaplasma bacterium]
MRQINLEDITKLVKEAVIEINYNLDKSLISLIRKAKENETRDLSKSILSDILENQEIAKEGNIPLCQDTGVVVVLLEVGNEITYLGDIYDAINEGVRQGYRQGFLRNSVVNHPFNRVNTKDNTPAIIHTKIIQGDKITMKIAAKGGGSENMSNVTMLTPTEGIEGVKKLVLDTIFNAGGRPCPPLIVGIGIGGNFEKSAILAKEAIFRALDDSNNDPIIKKLEDDLYNEINALGVGPMGVGGNTTCLAVKINYHPMHIASLPVAINIQCHSARHTEVEL